MNIYTVSIIIAAGLIIFFSFFGFVKGIGKSFQQDETPTIDGQVLQKEQSDRAEEVEERREQLMENLQQKIRDQRMR